MSLLRILMAGNAPPPAGKLFWRFNITASRTQDVYPTTVLEAEMRSAIGGADLCVGGTASASSQEGAYPASKAFDGLVGSEDIWVPLTQPLPQWLRYNLPAPAEIVEVMLQAATTTFRAARAPQSFDVQWSTDGVVWTTAFTVIGTPAWSPSEARTFTAQGDPYFDQGVSLLHFDGPNASTTSYDVMGNTVALNGSSQLRTDQSVFGGSSLYLNGTLGTRALVTPTRIPNMHGDLTVEGWFRVTAVGSSIIFVCMDGAVGTHAGHYFGALADGSLYLRFARDTSPANVIGIQSAPGQIAANTWYHLAFVKRGLGVAIYKDGVQVASGTLSEQPEPWTSGRSISIGTYYTGDSNWWSGWADDVRITNAARYDSDFTPPTEPFPNYRDVAVDPLWAKRIALLHFDGANGSTTFTDAKGAVWTPEGTAQISTAQSRFGGASLALTGAGNALSTPDTTAWSFGTEDFFMECWIYVPTVTDTKTILGQWGASTANRAFLFYLNGGTLTLALHPGPVFASLAGVTANTWHHVAAGRVGPNIYVWLNGVRSSAGSYTMQALPNPTNAVRIGSDNEGTGPFYGYIDELRVTRGVAPVGNFTPHGPFPTPDVLQEWDINSLSAPAVLTNDWLRLSATTAYTGAYGNARARRACAGKCYFSMRLRSDTSGSVCGAGVADETLDLTITTNYPGIDTKSVEAGSPSGQIFFSGASIGHIVGTLGADSVLEIAVDVPTRKVWMRRAGGSWFGGGDPAAGTSPAVTLTGTGKIYPAAWIARSGANSNRFVELHPTAATTSGTPPVGFIAANFEG